MQRGTTKQFDWSGKMEQLEERLFMTADSMGGFLGGQIQQHSVNDSIPSLEHHAVANESPAVEHFGGQQADFWINPDSQEALNQELERIEQSLANAHNQSGLSSVRANYGLKGGGQTVAVIDSGIAYDHFALGGGFGQNYRVVGGWDFTGENDNNPYDDGGAGSHGTHVSGIIGASGGTHEGVAPDVDLVGLRVFDDAGSGYFSWVENALQWVHDNRDSFENPITTVNLSLGVASWNADTIPDWANLEDEFAQLEADGIFIAVSAGNSFSSFGEAGLSYPAASEYVIPVASVDDNGTLSYFSQRNSRVIAAPGRGIISTVPDYAGDNNGTTDDYASFSGTSMASPYVAGASVIIREAMEFIGQTNITQDMIYDHMIATADSFFDSATSQSYSRLNLASAIDALIPTDDFGSTVGTAHDLGTINVLSTSNTVDGIIGKLDDADYFKFTAASTGSVNFTASNMTHNVDASWSVTGGTGTASGENNESLTLEVVAGQEYTVGFSSADGLGYYHLDVTAESSFSFTDWGSFGFGEVQDVSVSEETWFRVAADSTGYFTTEALFDSAGNQIHLELYNSDMQLIDSGNAAGGQSRVDHYAAAGEELYLKVIGSSSDVDFRMTNLVSVASGVVTVAGTAGDDAFEFTAGNTHLVSVNGVEYSFASTAVSNFNFEGGAGTDSIMMAGTAGDETATLRQGNAQLSGTGFHATATSVENTTVVSNGGVDWAIFYDTAGDDLFSANSTSASLSGNNYVHQANGFGNVQAYSQAGGTDRVELQDSSEGDYFKATSNYAFMRSSVFSRSDSIGYYIQANGFDQVHATAGSGGYDFASLYDSAGDDTFSGSGQSATLEGTGFRNIADGFQSISANSTSGGVDWAILSDTAGDDLFSGNSNSSTLSGTGYLLRANGFGNVQAYSNAGGMDRVELQDSSEGDYFKATSSYAFMRSSVFSRSDSIGYYIQVNGFGQVAATAGSGGYDFANMYDSSGNDIFSGSGQSATLKGAGFENIATGFQQISAFSTGGGVDWAILNDTAGDDLFSGSSTGSSFSGTNYLLRANGFNNVQAYSNAGGTDRAELSDSSESDYFKATDRYAFMRSTVFSRSENIGYYIQADGFDQVQATAGSGGYDFANLLDSDGDDIFNASGNSATLRGDDFENIAIGFQQVNAVGQGGGNDTMNNDSVDYLFNQLGTW